MLDWVKKRIESDWGSEVVKTKGVFDNYFWVEDGRKGRVWYDPNGDENSSITIKELLPEMPNFAPPFRVGRKRGRAILDVNGLEVVVLRKGLEEMAKKICDLLNTDAEQKANQKKLLVEIMEADEKDGLYSDGV